MWRKGDICLSVTPPDFLGKTIVATLAAIPGLFNHWKQKMRYQQQDMEVLSS
jgi:hypothetical protein